ncbi:MAG: calcium/sodium antiporter [Polyangiaceae bacterium]
MNDVVVLLAGGVMLYFGAEWLVGGASALALAMRVPQLLVGLTVVAYGTSAPEIIVGIQAAYTGHGDVALGNVIGSNIANFGLILGVAALVKPAPVDGALRRRELPVVLLTAALVPLLLIDARIQRWEAGLLLAGALGYTYWMVRTSRASRGAAHAQIAAEVTADAADIAGAPAPRGGRLRQLVTALAGLGVLLLGGHLFVDAAASLARSWGMSERLVGLTIVAIGTSLPELATSVIAASKGHSDIAVGNVIGSNIFNVFLCLGAAGLAGNVGAPLRTVAVDIGALMTITLVGCFFLRKKRLIARWEGALLVSLYAAFLGYLIVSGATAG